MTELDDIASLEAELGRIIAAVSPDQRRALAMRIGRDLRRSQSRRIAAQLNPEGTPFAPRKPKEHGRDRRGGIKRRAKAGPMFRKLRSMRWLTMEATSQEVAIGFANSSAARIALVHQKGLRDRVSRKPGAPEVTYAARGILGFTAAETAHILDMVAEQLAGGVG
ncbi:MAG: phage virion morphogenesis protein [Pseudomonadota bacterium]